MPPDGKPIFGKFSVHAWRTIGLAGHRELCPDMRQQDQLFILSATGRTTLSGKIPALADAKNGA